MITAYDHPPIEDVRLPKVPARGLGAPMMETGTPDDRSRTYSQYSGPSPPMHRIPPHSEMSHGLPGAPGVYDHAWRQYPPQFEHPHAEPRRVSNVTQPPISSHSYPPLPGRELPQPPTDGPYGRTPSLPTPTGPPGPSEAPPPSFHPMNNGAAQEASPLSAAPDYGGRPRMSYGPPDQPPLTNGNPPSVGNEYPTTVPPTVSHTPAPYDTGYYSSQGYNMRHRKATRAQQACDQCRARKAKCDEGRPACSHCKENQLICVYKEVPPHKQEKNTQLILDRIQQSDDSTDDKIAHLHRLHIGHDKSIDELKVLLLECKEFLRGNNEAQQPSQYTAIKPDGLEASQMTESKLGVALAADGTKPNDQDAYAYTKGLLQSGEDGELSIPVEHTTAAHKLLKWPSIARLLEGFDDDYVMKVEQSRGAIPLEGRGEAQERDDMNDTLPHHSPPAAVWNPNIKYNEAPPEIKGIDGYGVLSLDAVTVRRYFDSYLEHIHKLHPFLKEPDLERKVNRFIEMHCVKPGVHARNSMEAPRSAKRKRSGETLQAQNYDQRSPTEGPADSPPQKVRKTLSNAIVLLVLALGRICEVRNEPIRGPCTDHIIDYQNEPIPGVSLRPGVSPAGPEAKPSPNGALYSSFQSHWADVRSHSTSTPPVTDEKFITLPDPPELRNEDTVPGLVYYVYAARILSENNGVPTLAYVQAALLAGLYTGQLAHPFKSYAWINQAAIACQVLVRPFSKSYAELGEGEEQDIVNFAFWTCLQLESDILAELDLPASGISRSESRISLPKGKFTIQLPNEISSPNTMMMFFYSAQIHLRKILNRVHTDLYKVEKQGQTQWSPSVQETLSMNLDLWRSALPVEMKWKDHDPPSSDINVARMRAKFFGARYIIYRPILYAAIHMTQQDGQETFGGSPADYGPMHQQVSPSVSYGQRAPDMARGASDLNNSQGANGSSRSYRDLSGRVRRACRFCVQSAIWSTTAFDGIVGRPVVTNIFGTAHAQFGNMLVLSAVYMSHLSELISRSQLEQLLRRTIKFLLQYRNISPVLRIDAKILTHIYTKIFEESPTT